MFPQASVEYDKQPRTAGASGWTLGRKIRLVLDSVTGFSDAPIRACTVLGTVLIGASALLLAGGFARWVASAHSNGYLLLLVGSMAALGGLQLVATGVVGEYVWRALEESRRRPPYVIEAVTATMAESAKMRGLRAAEPPTEG